MKIFKGNQSDKYMLINTIHHRGTPDTGWKDTMDIVYKDLENGEKYVKSLSEPEIEVYFTKPELRNYDYNKTFVRLTESDIHTFKFRNLEKSIAKEAGDSYVKYIQQCIDTGNRGGIRNVHKCPFVFGSDYDIENWYRIQWVLNHDNNKPKPVTVQYLDIEVDGIDIEGFPGPGSCPINAVTLVDEKSNTCFTYALRNDENPLIEKMESKLDEFIETLHADFDESYGKLNYKILFYEDELKMIKDLFLTINILKRDFLMIWNMGFDIPFIIERIKVLGGDPIEIMCHKDFSVKEVYYKKDEINYMVENKSDFLKMSSYTIFLDQMIIYAGLRKGGGTLRSNALNAVARKELGDTKLDYSEDANIKTLPYVDYEKFIRYNIKDVLLQYGINQKTQDVENIYARAYANATAYHKVFKQSVFLKNRSYIEFFKQGLVIGNNANSVYGKYRDIDKSKDDDEDDSFSGGLVADPELNTRTGMKIMGSRSKYVYKLCIDMDFSSMYPHIIIAFNIAGNTMVAKLIIFENIEDVYNNFDLERDQYDSGKDFIDNLLTDNVLSIGSKWFNLPSIDKVVSEFLGKKNIRKIKMDKSLGNKYFPMGIIIDIEE